jgi:S1-C subfamily serine protease
MKLLILLMSLLYTAAASANAYTPALPAETVSSRMRSVETKIRNAAVRVTIPLSGGHGSGSYIKYKDVHLVITAQHVADAAMGTSYLISHKEESHLATLIYADKINDMAVLYVQTPFKSIEAMPFDPVPHTAMVGTEIYYSGYPSHHKLMSFAGRISGYENIEGPTPGKHIILQTYGWFGCSGSVIYNTKGQQVGVLYGVDVEYYPDIQVQENMIWVAPMNYMKINKALKTFCIGHKGKLLKACA